MMHRTTRGAGISLLDRNAQSTLSYSALSSSIEKSQLTTLHSQITAFRDALHRFASDHREEIRNDPRFRHQFQQMCARIGVDVLAGGNKTGGWWTELTTGMADWQYELGVQIVDICVSTREKNGGLIDITEIVRLLNKLRGANSSVTEADVERSINALKPLGAGYSVVPLGPRKYVRSVVGETDEDQGVVLSFSKENGRNGRVTIKELATSTGWTTERAMGCLEVMLLRDGTCWIDEQDDQIEGNRSYWVISAMAWD